MSNNDTQTNDEPKKPESSGSQIAHTERLFLRLTFWQTLLSVVGVFIAVVALYTALSESSAVRQQTAAAVWPFVQLSIAESDSGDSAEFTLSFTNAGVGPAKMRSMQVIIDGESLRDWADAVRSSTSVGWPTAERAFRTRNLLNNALTSKKLRFKIDDSHSRTDT